MKLPASESSPIPVPTPLSAPGATLQTPRANPADLSEELAAPVLDYLTQIDMNHILGNLFQALAAGRISPKRAAALAYIASVILQSQKGVHDQVRFMELTAFGFLKRELKARYGPKPPKPADSPSTTSPKRP